MTNYSDSIFHKLLLGNIEDKIPMKNLIMQLKITASVKKGIPTKNLKQNSLQTKN